MKFPLNIFADLSIYWTLVAAFAVGGSFGYWLEQAGFGSARKLTAQFYLKDFSVLKVMFTAVVVGAVGFWLMVMLGVQDLEMTYINPTYIVPQVVGGLILGIGFTIGGYCPGTSCVAASTGKLDALFYLAGVLFGILIFSEIEPMIHTFATGTALGRVFVWESLGVSPGIIVMAAVLMAIGAFTWGSIMEKKQNSVIQPVEIGE